MYTAFTPALTSLPAEILFDIAGYLSQQSLEAFSKTSVRALRISLELEKKKKKKKKIRSRSVLAWDLSYDLSIEPEWRDVSDGLDYWGISLIDLQKYTKLVHASQTGDISTVSALLQDGVSPNPPDRPWEEWLSPLQAASRENHRQVITLLLEAGAEILGNQAAVYNDDIHSVRLFLSGNIDRETLALLARHRGDAEIEWHRESLAHWACAQGLNTSQISNLMSIGLWSDDIGYRAYSGWYPIAALITVPLASSKNPTPEHYEVLRLLLSNPERIDNPCSSMGQYPIHQAVCKIGAETVRILLQEFGADPNIPLTYTGATPLRLAVERIQDDNDDDDSFAILQLLLDSGALLKDDAKTFKYAVDHNSRALRPLFDAWIARVGLYDHTELLLIAAAALGDVPIIQRLLPLCETQDPEADGVFTVTSKLPALDKAARFRHFEAVEVLLPYAPPHTLDAGAVIEYFIDSSLYRAISHSSEPIARLLLSRYRPRELSNCAGLISAAIHNQPSNIVSMILDRVAGPITPRYIRRILDAVATTGDYNMLLLLLKHIESHDVVPDPVFNTGLRLGDWKVRQGDVNPLISAAQMGHLSIVQALIKHWPEYIDERAQDTDWPLSMAIRANRVDIANALLAAGANPDPHKHGFVGTISLIWNAAYNGHAHIMEQLVAFGCDINSRNPHSPSSTLLSWASAEGAVDLVRLLLARKVNIHETDDKGRTALSHAAIHGKADVARLLIQAGASVDVVDYKGKTPLILALTKGINRLEPGLFDHGEDKSADLEKAAEDLMHTARVLLENGASAITERFHSLSNITHVPLLQFYLEHGLVRVDEVDDNGHSLMHYAVFNGSYSKVQILASAGFDVFKADGNGWTPLHFASDDEMIRTLYCVR